MHIMESPVVLYSHFQNDGKKTLSKRPKSMQELGGKRSYIAVANTWNEAEQPSPSASSMKPTDCVLIGMELNSEIHP